MSKRAWCVAALLAVSGCSRAAAEGAQLPSASAPPAGAIQVDAAEVAFKPGPPNLPKGVQSAVLEGNPKQPGIFTLRLKAPPGFVLEPHTHPVAERVTVISGSISVGFGDVVDKRHARTFGAGSFYVNPAKVPHFVFSEAGAVVQITGEGPWLLDYLTPPR